MDFSETPIVRECISVSDNIKDYFEEERYLAEVDQPEELTPSFVAMLAADLLLTELSEMGLQTSQTIEEIIEYPTEFNVVLDMRKVFDSTEFYNFIRRMPESKFTELEAVVEQCVNSSDLLFDIAEYCTTAFPNDERWINIHSSSEHWWWSDDNFGKHIKTLLDRAVLNSDPNKAVVDDHNITYISAFLTKFAERKKKATRFINYIIDNSGYTLNGPLLLQNVETYDKEKLRPSNIQMFANYAANPGEYKKSEDDNSEPDFVNKHHLTNKHHLEYWLSRPPKGVNRLQKEDLVMMTLTLALDEKTKDEMIHDFDGIVKQYCLSNEMLSLLRYLINLDYNAIMSGGQE